MCECPSNVTTSMPSEFNLLGLSWVQDKASLMSIPLAMMYSFACLANSILATVILLERSLHKPMYFYISMLAIMDLALSGSVIPKVLEILWFDSNTITSAGCLIQMFIFYSITGAELSLFTLMSFDRYIAICHPLRYSSIMTNSFTHKSVLLFVIRNMVLLSPLPYFSTHLQYCKSNNVINAFCEYVSLMRLACGDMTASNIYMYLLVCIHSLLDCILIGISYVLILRVVLKLGSSEARKKAFATCSSHIIVIVFFTISSTFSYLMYLLKSETPLYVQTMSTVLNSLIPPMLNPLVYGVRMTEIQNGLKTLSKKFQNGYV
ncbi:olfactory receptor 56A4-like [Lissotriton helveticus]